MNIVVFFVISIFILIFIKIKNMTEEELENWQAVDYRMRNEGIDYCFEHYSRFEEIKDEEFHKLRLEFLSSMFKIREYVKNTIESYEEEDTNML
jgi:hypothetical protein